MYVNVSVYIVAFISSSVGLIDEEVRQTYNYSTNGHHLYRGRLNALRRGQLTVHTLNRPPQLLLNPYLMRIIPGAASVMVTDVNNLRISLVWQTMQHNDVCTKRITVGTHMNADCLL